MAQQLVTSSLGGLNALPILSKKVRYAAQPLMKFRQFCTIKEAFGKNKGETVDFNKVSNLAAAGGTLTETSTIPITYYNIVQSSLTVTEWGNAAGYTGKLEALGQLTVKDPTIKALKNDQVKVIDAAVEAQMDACNIRYVASTGSTGNFYTAGSATQTASKNLDSYHVKTIVDYMLANNYPPADGENFMCIATVLAARGVHDDLEDVWKYTKYPVNGEIGSYYKCRFVRDTNSMDNSIGVSNVAGEAYFFGEDAVMEAVALPEELRYQDADFQRSQSIAWYAILGFKIIWSSDPDDRIIKFDSHT